MRSVTHADDEAARGGGSPSTARGYISARDQCPECGSRAVRVHVDPARHGRTMISKRCLAAGCEILFDAGLT